MPANPTIVFTAPGRVAVEDRPMPEPGDGQALVRTRRSLISTGTELTLLEGKSDARSIWGQITQYPFVPGYNNIGEVAAVGAGVDPALVGRRVGSYGPHTLHHVVEVNQLRLMQREVEDDQAVFFTTAEIVMNGVRRSKLLWGESVVVFGLGLLGQLAVRVCTLAGARPVFAVDVADMRLGLLPTGAGVVPLNASHVDVAAEVARLTRGRKADLVIELTGHAAAIPGEFTTLRHQGRFLVLSSPRGKTEFDFHDLCNAPSFTIIGAHNFSHPSHATPDNPWTFERDAELFFDWLADGAMDLRPLITHRAGCADATQMYRMLLEDRTRAMGVVLSW